MEGNQAVREFPTSIREALTQGLRPEPEVVNRENFLKECYNMKPSPFGLEDHVPATDPFEGGINTDWPWPQLLFLQEETLLAEETEVSTVNKSVSPWTVTGLGENLTIPPGGGVWHVADLGETWYLFKENCTVFKTGLHRVSQDESSYHVDQSMKINTGTSFKGRIIGGGFSPSNFWADVWDPIINAWKSDEPSGIDYQTDNIGKNWVAWSSIGGGDFPIWWFSPEELLHNLTADNVITRLKRAEIGWMPMPFDGWVLDIAPLGDNLVVYGEDGIAVMNHVAGEGGVVNSTFGVQKIADVGISGRGAVAKGQGQHVFLGSDGALWVFGQEGLNRLGYEEYVSGMREEEITSHYDSFDEEFHFCSPLEAFVLTGSGLAEHKDKYTGAGGWAGKFFGLSHEPGVSNVEIVTAPISLQIQAVKRIQSVQVHQDGFNDLVAELRARYDRAEDHMDVTSAPVNNEGVAHVRAAGVDFEVVLRASGGSQRFINKIDLRYQLPDKRGIRGPFQDAG